jgi:hypothetical protein
MWSTAGADGGAEAVEVLGGTGRAGGGVEIGAVVLVVPSDGIAGSWAGRVADPAVAIGFEAIAAGNGGAQETHRWEQRKHVEP